MLVFVILVSLITCGVAAEFAARFFIRRFTRYFVWPPGLEREYAPSIETLPELERHVDISFNSVGERGDPVPSGPHRHFLVLGSSAVESFLASQKMAWPAQIQANLNAGERLTAPRNPPVHVGTVARSSTDSHTLHFILERLLPCYRKHPIDTLIIMVGASDVVSFLKGDPQPQLKPIPPIDGIFHEHPEHDFGWKIKRLALTELARRVRSRIFRKAPPSKDPGALWLGPSRQARLNAPRMIDDVPDASEMVANYERSLSAALRVCQAYAKDVILIHQPWLVPKNAAEEGLLWNVGMGEVFRGKSTTYYSSRVFSSLMQVLHERGEAVARALNVYTINVHAELKRESGIFYDEMHYTPKGHTLFAKLITERLLDRRNERTGADRTQASVAT